jgi:hypothetical protein
VRHWGNVTKAGASADSIRELSKEDLRALEALAHDIGVLRTNTTALKVEAHELANRMSDHLREHRGRRS